MAQVITHVEVQFWFQNLCSFDKAPCDILHQVEFIPAQKQMICFGFSFADEFCVIEALKRPDTAKHLIGSCVKSTWRICVQFKLAKI